MAKAKKSEEKSNVTEFSNSKDIEDLIRESAQRMAAIDAQRKDLNRDAADIRQGLKDKGVDTDAFKDVYGYFKKRRPQREGYDEFHKLCFSVLNSAETGDLFAA